MSALSSTTAGANALLPLLSSTSASNSLASSSAPTTATSSSSLLSTSGGTLRVSGLASGLNTDQIIQGLMALDQAQIQTLQAQQAGITQQQTAFKGVQSRLLALQGDLAQLSKPQNNVFDARTVTASDTTALTGAASATASPGIYTLHVNTLATANQIASQGFADLKSAITKGQITVGLGQATQTITIDDSNDTLSGLATAINNANTGVSATVINDGSSQPYRLLLTAAKTGTANAITLTNNLAADSGGATRPLLTTTVQAATDASVTLGSGAGALTVTSSNNTVSGLINGVTLQLQSADPNKQLTVTVANDTGKAEQAITNFVSDYNGLIGYIDSQVSYDPQTQTAGVLLGDSSVQAIEDQVRNLVTAPVAGLPTAANRLGALGITTAANGQLTVDTTKLNDAVEGRVQGVSIKDVRTLFALTGTSSNPGIQFVTADDKTKAATTPYQVQITQAATQASLTAGTPLAGTTTVTAANNTLVVKVNGTTSGTITLDNGDYTPQALSQALQAKINADSTLAGAQVAASVQNGNLQLASTAYGHSSEVSIVSGTAVAALGFAGGETAHGQDVAGSFITPGGTETATGSGQLLVGSPGNANTADLMLRVTLSPADVSGGNAQGTVAVSRGLASQLNTLLNSLLDPVNGRLQTIDHSFQTRITDLQSSIDFQTKAAQQKQQDLVDEFTALEATISQLQQTGNQLAAQFTTLTSSTKSTGTVA